tara:strand:+ start:3286 stop:3687 length:402 start_codon:yes stop_codon:yes gene_type:complete
MSTLGTQANLTTLYTVRHTANTLAAPQAFGNPTSDEAGGNGNLYAMRDEVSAGNKMDRNSRANVVYKNYNYAGAAVIGLDGKIISGLAVTTHNLLKVTGGSATNADDNANASWTYSRGGTANTQNVTDFIVFK